MQNNLTKSLGILTKKEKRRLISLSILKIFNGLMDMIGILSIIPFLAFVSNKEKLGNNKYIKISQDYFQFNDNEMLIFLAVISLLILLINYLFRILDAWYSAYVNQNIFVSLSTKLFRYYITRPYKFHLVNSTNELLEKISVKVNFLVIGFIQPIFQIFGKVCTIFFIAIILVQLNTSVLLLVSLIIFFTYLMIFKYLKKYITAYGDFLAHSSQMLFKITDQALKSIKDIKINLNEKFYLTKFDDLTKTQQENVIKKQFFQSTPKLFLEIIVFTLGYVFIIYLLNIKSNSFSEIIIILGIFMLSFQRILPCVQEIYTNYSDIKYFKSSINKIFSEVQDAVNFKYLTKENIVKKSRDNIKFKKKIKFSNLKFKYGKENKIVLDIEKLELDARSYIGVTGKSGAGKSTFIDLITGLLEATDGSIEIDDKLLNKDLKPLWQSNIAYVPQQSFIADDTITRNIAFGVIDEEIDRTKINESAKIAKVNDFVEKELIKGFDTIIGENGIRLSGGQRQRLSIARALYFDHDVIILDEATSSLDAETEKEILENILKLKDKTIIMVTHRISTLKGCDKIIFFQNGKVIGEDKYKNLIEKQIKFSELAGKTN